VVVVWDGFSDSCSLDVFGHFINSGGRVDHIEERVTRLEEQVITLFKNFESVDSKLDKIDQKMDKELRVAMLERLMWLGVVAVISYVSSMQ
jgi:archaellum component FlaC